VPRARSANAATLALVGAEFEEPLISWKVVGVDWSEELDQVVVWYYDVAMTAGLELDEGELNLARKTGVDLAPLECSSTCELGKACSSFQKCHFFANFFCSNFFWKAPFSAIFRQQQSAIFAAFRSAKKVQFSPFFANNKVLFFAAFRSAKKSAIFAKNFAKNRLDPTCEVRRWIKAPTSARE
jgi:hypothetical protein